MLEEGDIDLEEDIFNLDLEDGPVGGTGLEAIIGKALISSRPTFGQRCQIFELNGVSLLGIQRYVLCGKPRI